jgi:preprotein translocase subunit YajC
MPRAMILLILLLVVIAGVLWFLSSRAEEVPTRTIEVDVNAPADAR